MENVILFFSYQLHAGILWYIQRGNSSLPIIGKILLSILYIFIPIIICMYTYFRYSLHNNKKITKTLKNYGQLKMKFD
jgi:hypothetical protein